MHFHAIILAALSAGALSVSLTAKDPTNSHNQPNVKCTGKDNGKNTYLIPGTCYPYSPPNGSYVWVDYIDYFGYPYGINVYDDSACGDLVTTIVPSQAMVKSDGTSDCVSMGEGVQWGSAKMGDQYNGAGVARDDGGVA